MLVLLLLPANRLPDSGLVRYDKVVHGGLFFLWGLAWRRGGLGTGWVVALGILMALGTELGQAFMGVGRHADVADAVADAVGLALGAWIARGRR